MPNRITPSVALLLGLASALPSAEATWNSGTLAGDAIVTVAPGTGWTPPASADLGGHRLTVEGESLGVITVAKQLTLGAGAELTLAFSAAQGGAELVNAGTVTQTGGLLRFRWTSPQLNNGVRRFVNGPGATWTFDTGARIVWETVNDAKGGGFGALYDCRNEGAMRIAGGSSITADLLFNTGTLTFAGGELGGTLMNTTLRNGPGGRITVVADSLIGHAGPCTGDARLENGTGTGGGATLEIGEGERQAQLTVRNGKSVVTNAAGSTVSIAPGGTLLLAVDATADANDYVPRQTTIINQGIWRLAGALRFQPNHNADATIGVINKGVFEVLGPASTIERLPAPRSKAYNQDSRSGFANHRTGTLRGAGTLSHRNATGDSAVDVLLVTNSGIIAPGTAEAVGTLVLRDADVRFSEAGSGTLAIRIAGAGADAGDRLELAGAHGGSFDLGEEGSTLAVTLAGGFVPRAAATWRIVDAARVAGSFATVKLPPGFRVVADARGLAVTYTP